MTKAELRRKIRAAVGHLSPAARAAASAAVRERLAPQMQSARTVLFFAPLPDEVDLWPLLDDFLAAGKVAALPRFDSTTQSYLAVRVRNLTEDIVAGKFGIREPRADCPRIEPGRLDLILVPGVAFDWGGRRLGRGRGYYDRLLSNHRALKAAIAFDEQMVGEIPAEPHDARMDFILTPSHCVKCAA